MSQLTKIQEYNNIINAYEAEIVENPVVIEPVHRFYPGIYTREIFIPKGVTLTSLVHKTNHPYFVTLGRINILTPDGILQVVAPYEGENKKGTRRLGFAVEDSIWTTCHPNPDNCRDIEVIEQRLFKKYNNPLSAGNKQKKI